MRSVISPRPALALARYHLLSGIRNAHGLFAMTFLLALLPMSVGEAFLAPDSVLWMWSRPLMMRLAAQTVIVSYFFHLLLLSAATVSVASPRRRHEGLASADLTETVPITSAERFLGDTLGVLACTLVIHLCTLPLLALAVALSPVSTSVFVSLELFTLAFMILCAASSAWKRRSEGVGGRLKVAGNAALFLTLVILIFAATTRWQNFRDAFFFYLSEPSPLRWTQLTREVMNPTLLAALLLLLYGGFLTFFAIQSIRALERRQEISQ